MNRLKKILKGEGFKHPNYNTPSPSKPRNAKERRADAKKDIEGFSNFYEKMFGLMPPETLLREEKVNPIKRWFNYLFKRR